MNAMTIWQIHDIQEPARQLTFIYCLSIKVSSNWIIQNWNAWNIFFLHNIVYSMHKFHIIRTLLLTREKLIYGCITCVRIKNYHTAINNWHIICALPIAPVYAPTALSNIDSLNKSHLFSIYAMAFVRCNLK